jgi:hypothetical protein
MSLDILLRVFLASFVIHVVDETTLNGGNRDKQFAL